MWLTDMQKIGVGLTSFGALFMLLGVMLFFDGALLALGNILFLGGLSLIIGSQKTFYFFARKNKLRGTACFFGGILLVFLSSGKPSACSWRCSCFSIFLVATIPLSSRPLPLTFSSKYLALAIPLLRLPVFGLVGSCAIDVWRPPYAVSHFPARPYNKVILGSAIQHYVLANARLSLAYCT
ncbi:hypothetical protein BGW80DRAFT_508864 [Lactifluus volemus]|nr:hypothetical protein BGW80DRAFT_508864 [Lactifluus volemus]